MKDRYVDKIVENFCGIYKKLKMDGIVNDRALSHPAENNLHSWLQYALVLAGTRAGLDSPVEIKLDFESNHPLEPKKYGVKRKTGRKRTFSRVDVAFFRKGSFEVEGFGEVNTTNDATVFLPTELFATACRKDLIGENQFTVMDSDVLRHTLSYIKQKRKPNFVILVVTLPKEAPFSWLPITKAVGQEDKRVKRMAEILEEGGKKKNLDEACRWGWIKLRDDISRETSTDCSLIVINEDGAEFVKRHQTKT